MIDSIPSRLRKELGSVYVPLGMRSFVDILPMRFAFFPGASGLWQGDEADFPIGGTLILGSNFGSVQSHLGEYGNLLRQDERHGKTWAPLVKALREAGIAPEKCFFTNAWPLLHDGRGNCSGQIHRWLRDRQLMNSCLQFFQLTLTLVQPRLIVALGVGPAAFCASIWPLALAAWSGEKWSTIDNLPYGTVPCGNHNAICVAVTHTCRPNWKHRKQFNTRTLEVELLRAARTASLAL